MTNAKGAGLKKFKNLQFRVFFKFLLRYKLQKGAHLYQLGATDVWWGAVTPNCLWPSVGKLFSVRATLFCQNTEMKQLLQILLFHILIFFIF